MQLRAVDSLQVVHVNLTITVSIQLAEGLRDDSLASSVQLTRNRGDELLIGDLAVAVPVENIEQSPALLLRYLESEVAAGFPELLDVERARIVVVNYSENPLQTENTTGSSLVQPLSELIHKLRV